MDINEITAVFGQEFSGSPYYSDCIDRWRRIYRGEPDWRRAAKGGLFSRGKRDILRLNMAKVLCDSLSALTFSEQCEITLDIPEYQAYIDSALNANGFWKQLPELLSKAYALGGAVLKCYLSGGKPRLDYITAERFVPTEWDGGGIRSGIISGTYARGTDCYHLLEYMRDGRSEFKLFKAAASRASGEELGRECPLAELFPELQSPVDYEGGKPVFAYFRPFVSNNSLYDVPLGMSVYANCTDTLRALDTVFDSLQREFVLGKKRIIVPSQCIRTIIDPETGESARYSRRSGLRRGRRGVRSAAQRGRREP